MKFMRILFFNFQEAIKIAVIAQGLEKDGAGFAARCLCLL